VEIATRNFSLSIRPLGSGLLEGNLDGRGKQGHARHLHLLSRAGEADPLKADGKFFRAALVSRTSDIAAFGR